MKKKINFVGNYEILTNNEFEVKSIIECIDWLKPLELVSLDTETEGFFDHENQIIMLQLSDGIEVWVVDVRNTNYLSLIKPYIEDKLVLGQNLKFDYKFLKFHGIILDKIYDTFLAECILTNGIEDRKLGLGALTEKYCNKSLDKSVRNQFIGLNGKPFTSKQIVYGAEDVLYLFEIREKQLEKIRYYNLEPVLDLENKACLALADIEYNGMCFNPTKWLELSVKAENNISLYESELDQTVANTPELSKYVSKYVQNDLFGGQGRAVKIKWTSPPQVLKVFKDLGMVELEDVLENSIRRYQDEYPIVKKFIDYKKEQKLATTYGKDFLKFINKKTKRIHTDFWQILNTHRISSSRPNLQQIPAKKEYYNCFEAPKGYKIVGADFSGQEARLAAEGSKDPIWLKVFKDDGDLHSEVAAMIFGVDVDKTRDKPEFVYVGNTKVYLRGKSVRDIAKTLNFGMLYGMSEFKLSNSLGIEVKEAKAIIDQYFIAIPGLSKYLRACANYGITKKYIRSFKPYSGIRFFDDYNMSDSKDVGSVVRASYNSPIQMTGALMCKLAMVNMREVVKTLPYKVEIFLQVHDALFTYVEEKYAEEWSILQKEIMEDAGRVFITSIPVISDLTITDVWSK